MVMKELDVRRRQGEWEGIVYVETDDAQTDGSDTIILSDGAWTSRPYDSMGEQAEAAAFRALGLKRLAYDDLDDEADFDPDS